MLVADRVQRCALGQPRPAVVDQKCIAGVILESLAADPGAGSGTEASQSCVAVTIAGARSRGYEVVILTNAHASGDGGVEADRMNRLWAQQGMTVVSIADLDVGSLCP